MKRLLIIGAVVLTALSSSGVSMIGGGKISSDRSKFVMNVPNEFRSGRNNTNDLSELTLQGPLALIPGEGAKPQNILVREFSVHYPQMVDSSAEEISEFFESNGWAPWDPSTPDCRMSYLKVSATAVTYVATWGDGQGVVLAGPRTPQVRDAIAKMADTIQISDGACAWD